MSTALPRGFKGEIVTSSSSTPEAYAKAIARWAANSVRPASYVFFVKDAEDVIIALDFAKQHGLQIAIRGGGHNVAGASSVGAEGLVIDLNRYMNTCRVEEREFELDGKKVKEKVAIVGGGAIWETVDKETIKHGLATVAGTVNHTGVAGLTLGGGYGWLTPSFGLTIDNLLQATLVNGTSTGQYNQVVTTSPTSHPDLFWAIRGGGCNFGVCTEFVFRLHKQRPTVFAGKAIFSADKLEDVFKVVDEWWKYDAGDKSGIGHMVTLDPHYRQPCTVVVMMYNGTEEEGRKHFGKFFALGPLVDDTKEIPFEELNALQNVLLPHGLNYYLSGTGNVAPSLHTLTKVLEEVKKFAGPPPAIPGHPEPTAFTPDPAYAQAIASGLTPVFVCEWLSLKKVMDVPVEKTAFRRVPTPNVISMFVWPPAPPGDAPANGVNEEASSAQDPLFTLAQSTVRKIIQFVHEGQEQIKANEAGGLTEQQKLGYTNFDPDATNQAKRDKSREVFGDAYPKLQVVKGKYDPEMRFCRWFCVTPQAAQA